MSNDPKKVHLELEPGVVYCNNRLAEKVTINTEYVTCSHCKQRLNAIRSEGFKKTIPF